MMMNKYEKALDRIAYNYGLSALDGDTNKIMDEKFNEDIKVLQELVDLATPKKPIGAYTHMTCPTCGSRIRSGNGNNPTKDTVCRNCFQRLDRSDN